jgi:FAD/FMN-containing dehydrogenase
MLINLRRLNSVAIVGKTAVIGGGAVWGDVVPKAFEAGLAPLSGSSPGVGVVGYTLGGGFPIMSRTYGLAVDSVHSVQLVTPEGELMRASRTENAEVFRCLMGGGGAFGVVTEIVMELFPSPHVYGGQALFPAERAEEVFAFYAECANAPGRGLHLALPHDLSPRRVRARAATHALLRDLHCLLDRH